MRRKYGPLIGLPVNNSASNFAGAARSCLGCLWRLTTSFLKPSVARLNWPMYVSVAVHVMAINGTILTPAILKGDGVYACFTHASNGGRYILPGVQTGRAFLGVPQRGERLSP